MRKIVATIIKGLYLLLTELIAMYLVVLPVYGFQISQSSTGYVRVATSTALAAYQAAQKATFVSAVASAVSAPTAASVALRIATGPIGWGLLGVTAAVTLAQMYYSQADIAAVKEAASPVNTSVLTWTYQGTTYHVSGLSNPTANPGCPTGFMWFDNLNQASFSPRVPGMTATTIGGYFCVPSGSQFATSPPTQPQVVAYLDGLPAGSPNSVQTHTSPAGQGVNPTSADNVTTVQVSPEQVIPTVKPASQVLPTDAVIDPNAPPPTGPQPVTTPSTTTTTTTTTTTNPNGSTTTQQTDDAGVMSCTIGNHDQRTFGSVLQDHMNRWGGSGLAGALNLIKNLAWPESIPTYAISSNTFGNFTLDFSGWSGVLLALRGLVIAMASFVAYRIIFVGSK